MRVKGHRVGSLARLARQLGYESVRDRDFTRKIRLLTEWKVLAIQQSGYVGDSMHHIKLVSMQEQAFAFLQRANLAMTHVPLDQPTDPSSERTSCLDALALGVKHQGLTSQRIGVDIVGSIVRQGSGLYIRIPQSIVEYYEMVAGDKVKVGILQRENWRDFEETVTE